MTRSIVLIGARGSGKTTVGRLLADLLGLPCIDLDDRVMAAFAEPTVHEVWRAHGEQAWRSAELTALEECLDGAPKVLSLGGGVPTLTEARKALEAARQAGRVQIIYLRCSAETLYKRLQAAPGDRPPLTDAASPAEEISLVLARRAADYEATADEIIDADEITAEQIAAMISSGTNNE